METARNPKPATIVTSPSASADSATATSSASGPAVAPEADKPGRSRRPFLILAAVVLVAAGAVAVYRHLTAGQETTDDGQVAADTVPVATRVGGIVSHVAVHEDQLVKKGDLLAQIDDTDYLARVQQAEADLAIAQAQAASAEAEAQIVEPTARGGLDVARAALRGSSVGVSSAESQVAAARAALARAEADAHKAELDLTRAKALKAASAIPAERLDAAQVAFDSARAGLAQAKAEVALANDARNAAQSHVGEARGRLSQSTPIAPQIAAAKAGVELAHARVRSMEAAVTLARLQLGYTRILSPVDGVASKLTVHDGQLVTVGQPVIALVPSATYVIANFKETQIGDMRVGQRAEIELDAFPGKKFEGRVESLSGGTGASFSLLPADNATGNFVKVVQRVPVRVSWKSPPADAAMRAGLSADVTVFVGK
jgi:membrane fusion protein (multidrug efflux system)